jgi:hypothetical protein
LWDIPAISTYLLKSLLLIPDSNFHINYVIKSISKLINQSIASRNVPTPQSAARIRKVPKYWAFARAVGRKRKRS